MLMDSLNHLADTHLTLSVLFTVFSSLGLVCFDLVNVHHNSVLLVMLLLALILVVMNHS